MKRIFFVLFACLLFVPLHAAVAATGDDMGIVSDATPAKTDLETLLQEAQVLFAESRPIDARTKLLKALQIAPNDYRAHMFLGAYYLGEVGHFQLANRYLRTSEMLFEKQYGSDRDGTLSPDVWKQHARLLYFLSESELNLDKYQKALETLDRFGKRYWDDWYPGARAWVLMKLRRVDEAIGVAQAGLLRGAEPGRTYNILGILLSLKDNRELSLKAFAKAIQTESIQGGGGQVATPLNNAGEVFRELFQDTMAEAAWVQAVRLPDGCDHILPSLNLATLYIDELRLFQAERVLSDFQACFANHSTREDTEHRALLALSRGRIALRRGLLDEALKNLGQAGERQQWFGKIGTNENDVRFAASVSMAQALRAEVAVLHDKHTNSLVESLTNLVNIPWLSIRAWWLERRARGIALEELSDFEDLHVRNTDTMLEYPTFGSIMTGFPLRSIEKRLERLKQDDQRPLAHSYYQVYLAQSLLQHGNAARAISLLEAARGSLRGLDRLLHAEILATLIQAREENREFWRGLTTEELKQNVRERQELYRILASHVRYRDLALPIVVEHLSSDPAGKQLLSDISDELTERRFEVPPAPALDSVDYKLSVRLLKQNFDPNGGNLIEIALIDRRTGQALFGVDGSVTGDGEGMTDLLNKFIDKTFSHRIDPPGEALPRLDLLEKAAEQ